CGNSNLSLQQLINIAYQNGNFSVVIRDVNTGNLETFQLDPPDDGNQDGGNQDGGQDGGGDAGNAANAYDTRFLRLKNATGENLSVFVQYYTLNDQNEWVWLPNPPGGERVIEFQIEDGADTNLFVDGWRLNANRVRIWARSGTKQWDGYRDRDLELV